jgi:osmotically-inducible protein OsmY
MRLMQAKIAEGPRAANPENAARVRLKGSGRQALQGIACHYTKGTIFLRGKVPTYFQKQTAQEMVRNLKGVTKIVNEIHVTPLWLDSSRRMRHEPPTPICAPSRL